MGSLKQEGEAEELVELRRIIELKDLEIAEFKAKYASIASVTQQINELTINRDAIQRQAFDMNNNRLMLQLQNANIRNRLTDATSQLDIVKAELADATKQRDDRQRENTRVLEELTHNRIKLNQLCRQHIPASQLDSKNIQTVYLVRNAADDVYQYKMFALRKQSNAGYEKYMDGKPARELVKAWFTPKAKSIIDVLREVYLCGYMCNSDLDLPARKNEAWLIDCISTIIISRILV